MTDKEEKKEYRPSEEQAETIKKVYDEFSLMQEERKKIRAYFNNRTPLDFWDDSELRYNGFVPSRAEQGKENWQANVFSPTTRNKVEAILASVALGLPEVRIAAQNEKMEMDEKRAEVIKNLVKYSYCKDNLEEKNYFEALEMVVKGTVITYEGYLRGKAKRKIIKSFDPETGKVEYDEEEVIIKDECVDFIIPLENFYIKDFFIRDIQDQPSICWVEKMNKGSFDEEFNQYPNHKFVKDKSGIQDEERFFKKEWEKRVSKDSPIEVIRYFNKYKDDFFVIANGVLLHESPMILGKKEKLYPFAKSIAKAFSSDFFYGNSFPNALMGLQDPENSLLNMTLDKTFKSLVPPMLIGNINKDDFDLEDEYLSSDTRIYVQDISQVQPMVIPGVTQSEIKMLEIIKRELDLASVDQNQQGITEKGVTARATVIANENAKKLKGVVFMFRTSHWLQKYTLRIQNILTYYTQPKVEKIIGEDGKENTIDKYRKFMIETELSDESQGMLGIQMTGTKADLPGSYSPLHNASEDLDKEVQKAEAKGMKLELISISSDYLDDWRYDIKVVSESVYQNDSSYSQARMEDKNTVISKFFPEQFATNKKKFFKDTLIAYDDDPEDYEIAPPVLTVPVGEPTAQINQLPPL